MKIINLHDIHNKIDVLATTFEKIKNDLRVLEDLEKELDEAVKKEDYLTAAELKKIIDEKYNRSI